jgi:hypothetical protein
MRADDQRGINHTATKEDITGVNHGLDRIEHRLLEEQTRKIEDLKQRMKCLEDALAV